MRAREWKGQATAAALSLLCQMNPGLSRGALPYDGEDWDNCTRRYEITAELAVSTWASKPRADLDPDLDGRPEGGAVLHQTVHSALTHLWSFTNTSGDFTL